MIRHGGLLCVFSFTYPIRGAGHVQGIYPQACPDSINSFFAQKRLSSGRIVPTVTLVKGNSTHPT